MQVPKAFQQHATPEKDFLLKKYTKIVDTRFKILKLQNFHSNILKKKTNQIDKKKLKSK